MNLKQKILNEIKQIIMAFAGEEACKFLYKELPEGTKIPKLGLEIFEYMTDNEEEPTVYNLRFFQMAKNGVEYDSKQLYKEFYTRYNYEEDEFYPLEEEYDIQTIPPNEWGFCENWVVIIDSQGRIEFLW